MKRFPRIAAPIVALLSVGSVVVLNAQPSSPPLPGKADPARVMPGRYTVDAAHTLVGWKVDHFGFNDYFGIFGDVTGTLQIDPDDLAATKLDVSIPISKVTVASPGLRDHLLRPGKDGGKPDFFGAAPADARFVSVTVKRTGPVSANIMGNLTLNGVTRPVTIAAEFSGAGNHPMNRKLNIGFHGRATIKRSDFGIVYAIPLVSDAVELDLSAAFEKAEDGASGNDCMGISAGA